MSIVVGILQVELRIPHAESLKDKRRVIKSLKDKIGSDYNVSIAEVDDDLDKHREALLGISMVANDGQYIRTCFDKIVNQLKIHRGASLVDYQIDFV
jgi:uncharacterized protein YlxP (DUF503 family)